MGKFRAGLAIALLVAVPAICDLAGQIERATAAEAPAAVCPAPAEREGKACKWRRVACDPRLKRAAPNATCWRYVCSDPKESR